MTEIEETNAVLHGFIEAFDEQRREVFFIQIGSNDGRQDDPLHPFVTGSRWHGVLVEPVPYLFERLQRTYADREDLTLVESAITDHDGTVTFYSPDETSDALPAWYDQVGSLSLDTILDDWTEKQIPDLRRRIKPITVRCMTFESLCRHAGVTRVDVIHLDTEGHDYEIIKGLRLDRHEPAVVIYEHKHLSAADRTDARALLHEHGYATTEVGYDTLCVQHEVLTAGGSALVKAWDEAERAPSWHE